MTQQELAVALAALTLQEQKIAQEQSDRFDALTAAIAELNAALAEASEVSPEVQASLDALEVAVQNLDDAIPDAPVVEEPPVEG